MDATYQHYRVPEMVPTPEGGSPNPFILSRYYRGDGFKDMPSMVRPKPKGGLTACVMSGNGRQAVGLAWCSHSDNFCYEVGRRIARGRALEQLERREA